MREITFTAKCCDSRYGYENYFYKTVTGTGYKVECGDSYLYVDYEWVEIEVDTLRILDVIK